MQRMKRIGSHSDPEDPLNPFNPLSSPFFSWLRRKTALGSPKHPVRPQPHKRDQAECHIENIVHPTSSPDGHARCDRQPERSKNLYFATSLHTERPGDHK